MLHFSNLVIATHNAGKIPELKAILQSPAPEHAQPARGIITANQWHTAGELGIDAPEETGRTFRDNAILKATTSASKAGMPAFADDSGLCVDLLNGAPGVESARWAENASGDRDFAGGMQRIEQACRLAWQRQRPSGVALPTSASASAPTPIPTLADLPPVIRAHFVSALALVIPQHLERTLPRLAPGQALTDPETGAITLCATGVVTGHLQFPPRGTQGFGYDPIFVPSAASVAALLGGLQPAATGKTFAEIPPALKDAISHRAAAFASLRQTILAAFGSI
ncbi:MAG: hypothetical protein K0U36_06330 [Alphaproteobacteria bacterium]|nr:hypothetical protein [Alphaproteobacteria bacterium]